MSYLKLDKAYAYDSVNGMFIKNKEQLLNILEKNVKIILLLSDTNIVSNELKDYIYSMEDFLVKIKNETNYVFDSINYNNNLYYMDVSVYNEIWNENFKKNDLLIFEDGSLKKIINFSNNDIRVSLITPYTRIKNCCSNIFSKLNTKILLYASAIVIGIGLNIRN